MLEITCELEMQAMEVLFGGQTVEIHIEDEDVLISLQLSHEVLAMLKQANAKAFLMSAPHVGGKQ